MLRRRRTMNNMTNPQPAVRWAVREFVRRRHIDLARTGSALCNR
jgi:hypothetical protein